MDPVTLVALVHLVDAAHGLVIVEDHGRTGQVNIAFLRPSKPAADTCNEKKTSEIVREKKYLYQYCIFIFIYISE